MTRQPACMWNWEAPTLKVEFCDLFIKTIFIRLNNFEGKVCKSFSEILIWAFFFRYPWIFLKMLSRFGLCKKGRMAGKEKQIGRPRKIFCQHWYWGARQGSASNRKYEFHIKRPLAIGKYSRSLPFVLETWLMWLWLVNIPLQKLLILSLLNQNFFPLRITGCV